MAVGHAFRVGAYLAQTGRMVMTPAQRRRARRKLGHALAVRGVTSFRTVKLSA